MDVDVARQRAVDEGENDGLAERGGDVEDLPHQGQAVGAGGVHDAPAGGGEAFEPFERRAAERAQAGDEQRPVGHLADLQTRAVGREVAPELRQQRLVDEIEVEQAVQQPLGQLAELPLARLAFRAVLPLGPEAQPERLDGMDDTEADQRPAAGHQHIDAGKMVFDEFELPPPRLLVGNRARVVPLALAGHGRPGQVMDAQGDAQRRLPVALGLEIGERKIPSSGAVQLRGHGRAPELPHRALALLGGIQLHAVVQEVNAGDVHVRVAAHDVAVVLGLGGQCALLDQVPGQGDAVGGAPVGDGAEEAVEQAVAEVVVEAQTREGWRAVGQVPDDFGQVVEEVIAEGPAVGVGQVVGEGQAQVGEVGGGAQARFVNEVRFVGEDSGDGVAEVAADAGGIALMGQGDEAAGGGGIEHVAQGCMVPAGARFLDFEVGIPDGAGVGGRRIVFPQSPGVLQATIGVQPNVVAGQQASAVVAFQRPFTPVGLAHAGGRLGGAGRRGSIRPRGEKQVALAALGRVAGEQAACIPGRPAILVVQPGVQPQLGGPLSAGRHTLHELGTQVLGVQAGARVHEEPAHPHLAEPAGLPAQTPGVKTVVPSPERGSAERGRRLAKDARQGGGHADALHHVAGPDSMVRADGMSVPFTAAWKPT
ncbi:MAG: hypothetical protein BWZ02_03020 [Lentisphaerae bacterium ADurb.BinA184]|nr:MAG: hypothetical protein BWZ02_03020 [Lentisphaerae bacterium ADurb.BinA184]